MRFLSQLFRPPLTPLSRPLREGSFRKAIPSGTEGTAATISAMQDLVSSGKRDRLVRNLAGRLIRDCQPKNYWCYAEKIFRYCRDDIKYAFDPVAVEYVESPRRLIEAGIGDCDSIVILFAALCENIGFPCRFVTIKSNPNNPEEFTHVYAEVKVPKHGWISADCTMPDKPFGWAPPEHHPRKAWNASKDEPPEGFDEDMSAYDYETPASPIPGVQDSPGVFVENPYSFREEPTTLITGAPEELELQVFGRGSIEEAVVGQPHEYWTASELTQVSAEPRVPQTAPVEDVQAGLGDEVARRRDLLSAAGLLVLGLLLWR